MGKVKVRSGSVRCGGAWRGLADIANAEGCLTPNAVVRAAMSPKHPLHGYFEWDNKKAGEMYRLDQARTLIAFARVEISERNIPLAIAFVRNPEAQIGEQGYRATTHIANEESQAAAAVIAELDRTLSCLARAKDVADAVGVLLEVNDLISRTEALAHTLRKLRAVG